MEKVNVIITEDALAIVKQLETDKTFNSVLGKANSTEEVKELFKSKDLLIEDEYAQAVLDYFEAEDLSEQVLENVSGGRSAFGNWAITMAYTLAGAVTGGPAGAINGAINGTRVACTTDLKNQSIWDYWFNK